jgi:hypothetical protein
MTASKQSQDGTAVPSWIYLEMVFRNLYETYEDLYETYYVPNVQ